MARKNGAKTPQKAADTANTRQEAAVDEPAVGTGGPELRDDHDQIIEEAPGFDRAADMTAPMGDPGDLGAFGRSALLPDDIGGLGDKGFDGSVDPGGEISDFADQVDGMDSDGGGTVSDFADQVDGMDSDGGGGMSDLDDQTGWKMDDDESGSSQDRGDRILGGTSAEQFTEGSDEMTEEAMTAYMAGNDVMGDFLMEAAAAAEDAADELNVQEDLQSGGDPDDDDDGHSGGGDGPPKSETMPAPDDGTGGQPDESDFIGGPGNVDPASETEPAGPAGELVGGRGDVDPASETEHAGPAGELIGGRGDIDPFDGKSSLLGDDTGDLAEMAGDADLGDIVIDVSLADADLGDEV